MFDQALKLVIAEAYGLVEYTEPKVAQQLLSSWFVVRTATAFPAGRREVIKAAREMVELPAFELLWPILLHEWNVEKLGLSSYLEARKALSDHCNCILSSRSEIS